MTDREKAAREYVKEFASNEDEQTLPPGHADLHFAHLAGQRVGEQRVRELVEGALEYIVDSQRSWADSVCRAQEALEALRSLK